MRPKPVSFQPKVLGPEIIGKDIETMAELLEILASLTDVDAQGNGVGE